jgi:hypothetical protein
MNRNRRNPQGRGFRTTCAIIGASAFATLTVLTVAAGSHPGSVTDYRAGSGDAPANTTYSVPSAPTMNLGATATFSAPGSEAPTVMASPGIKAAPYSGA